MGISFSGTTLIASSEGGYRFSPGIKARDHIITKPARGTTLIVKDAGASGAEHNVELRFFLASASNVNTVVNRVNNLCNKIGTLSVDHFGSYQNCIISGKPLWSESHKIKHGIMISCRIVFLQL